MDNANDGDCEALIDIYNNQESVANKMKLLEYKNKRAEATALHLAANNGHVEIVEFLVNKIIEDVPDKQNELINR